MAPAPQFWNSAKTAQIISPITGTVIAGSIFAEASYWVMNDYGSLLGATVLTSPRVGIEAFDGVSWVRSGMAILEDAYVEAAIDGVDKTGDAGMADQTAAFKAIGSGRSLALTTISVGCGRRITARVVIPLGVSKFNRKFRLYIEPAGSATAVFSAAMTVAGTLTVAGATTLQSTLAVTGNTTIGGTLGITGATTVGAPITAAGAVISTQDGFLARGANLASIGYQWQNAAGVQHWMLYQNYGAAGQQGVLWFRDMVTAGRAFWIATGLLAAEFAGTLTSQGGLIANTIAERTAAAGVTIDGTLIKDGNIQAPQYGGTLSADGAVPIVAASQLFIITKGSAAALTLANPTAGTHDRVRYTFVSATAFAHQISNAAGAGFNGGGAASDVATFGAAKGNSITWVAHQGVWYQAGAPLGVTLG